MCVCGGGGCGGCTITNAYPCNECNFVFNFYIFFIYLKSFFLFN